MDLIYFTLWFLVTMAMLWDTRRVHLESQAIMRDVAASTERIALLTAAVLRRTPAS